ncbi:hypothetical protein DESC_760017 [Desulfosarcina cetonica]|nr:hypothetical protein DESC_760017 [Desulfosarcina cetonica]
MYLLARHTKLSALTEIRPLLLHRGGYDRVQVSQGKYRKHPAVDVHLGLEALRDPQPG